MSIVVITCPTCGQGNHGPQGAPAWCGKCGTQLYNPPPATANHVNYNTDPCTMCHGRGVVDTEDAQGRPIGQATCSYCRGTKTSTWAAANQQETLALQKDHRLAWWILNILLLLIVFGIPGDWGGWKAVAVVFGVPMLLWNIWRLRPRSSNTARQRFTTQEELNARNLAGGALVAGLIFKQSVQHHNHHHQAAVVPPPPQQPPPPPYWENPQYWADQHARRKSHEHRGPWG